jgi:hypothetical protein
MGKDLALHTKYQTVRSLYGVRSLELKKSDRRYNQSINPPPDAAMTIKELLIQEIESTPDELLADLLSLVRSLKSPPHPQLNTYEQLLDRIDYLEAIIGIRKGLESFDRGEGIPVEKAMTALQQQFNIPPRL